MGLCITIIRLVHPLTLLISRYPKIYILSSIPFWIDHHFETPRLSVSAACRVGMYELVAALGRLFWECRAQPVSSGQWVKSQLSTWDTLALVTSCMGTISSDIGDILLYSDIPRGQTCDMWPGLQWTVTGQDVTDGIGVTLQQTIGHIAPLTAYWCAASRVSEGIH